MVFVMVSNDEIKQRLLEKRSGSPKKKFNQDQSLSSEELKQKFREKREQEIVENQEKIEQEMVESQEKVEPEMVGSQEKIEHPGYLLCDSCGGYYELQPGESKDDFADECECGGKLRYSQTLDDLEN
jgi:hypothetical protein